MKIPKSTDTEHSKRDVQRVSARGSDNGHDYFPDHRAATKQMRMTIAMVDASPRVAAQSRVSQLVNADTSEHQVRGIAPPVRAPTVAQLKTSITHTPGTFNSNGKPYFVGTNMSARLDYHDPIKGSATGTNWIWMKSLREKFPAAGVVRGHLLNHDLGGYAVPENLYPISTEANSKHSHSVEQNVKKLLSDQAEKSESETAHSPVFYDVDVVNVKSTVPNYDTEAAFSCHWGVGGFQQRALIPSNLAADVGKFTGSGSNKSPGGWQHGDRKGEQDFEAVSDDGEPIGIIYDDDFEAKYRALLEESTREVPGGGHSVKKTPEYYLARIQEGAYDFADDEYLIEVANLIESGKELPGKVLEWLATQESDSRNDEDYKAGED